MRFRVHLLRPGDLDNVVREIEADTAEQAFSVMSDLVDDGDDIEVYQDVGISTSRGFLTGDPFELVVLASVDDGLVEWRSRTNLESLAEWQSEPSIGVLFL